MTYNEFANNDQTLVALIDGYRVPIVGWHSCGRPITPLNLTHDVWPDVLDTKTNYVYRYKDGVRSVGTYEEIIND